MNVNETLYLRDDEIDEFGDSGAYGESLEEDYEEEEEEEEAELPGVTGSETGVGMPAPAAPMPTGGGGGGSSVPLTYILQGFPRKFPEGEIYFRLRPLCAKASLRPIPMPTAIARAMTSLFSPAGPINNPKSLRIR